MSPVAWGGAADISGALPFCACACVEFTLSPQIRIWLPPLLTALTPMHLLPSCAIEVFIWSRIAGMLPGSATGAATGEVAVRVARSAASSSCSAATRSACRFSCNCIPEGAAVAAAELTVAAGAGAEGGSAASAGSAAATARMLKMVLMSDSSRLLAARPAACAAGRAIRSVLNRRHRGLRDRLVHAVLDLVGGDAEGLWPRELGHLIADVAVDAGERAAHGIAGPRRAVVGLADRGVDVRAEDLRGVALAQRTGLHRREVPAAEGTGLPGADAAEADATLVGARAAEDADAAVGLLIRDRLVGPGVDLGGRYVGLGVVAARGRAHHIHTLVDAGERRGARAGQPAQRAERGICAHGGVRGGRGGERHGDCECRPGENFHCDAP